MAINNISHKLKYFTFFAVLWLCIMGVSYVQQSSSLNQVVLVAKGSDIVQLKAVVGTTITTNNMTTTVVGGNVTMKPLVSSSSSNSSSPKQLPTEPIKAVTTTINTTTNVVRSPSSSIMTSNVSSQQLPTEPMKEVTTTINTTSTTVGSAMSVNSSSIIMPSNVSSQKKLPTEPIKAITTTTSTTTTTAVGSSSSSSSAMSVINPLSIMTTNIPSQQLPTWLLEYGIWHTEQRKRIEESDGTVLSWNDVRILIVRCNSNYDRCGGFADRLKFFDFHLLLCAQNKRMIFYYWERPLLITEFLLPGPLLNWTVPPQLLETIQNNTQHKIIREPKRRGNNHIQVIRDPNVWVYQGSFNAPPRYEFYELQEEWNQTNFSTTLYSTPTTTNTTTNASTTTTTTTTKTSSSATANNNNNNNNNNNDITNHNIMTTIDYWYANHLLHDMFHSLFRPVPTIYESVIQHMNRLHLVPNQFNAAHLRSIYPREPYDKWNTSSVLLKSCILAIECASSLHDNDNYNSSSSTTTITNNESSATTSSNNNNNNKPRTLFNFSSSSSFSSSHRPSPPIYFAADNILALSLAQNWTRTTTTTSTYRNQFSNSSSSLMVVSHLDAALLPSKENAHLHFHESTKTNTTTTTTMDAGEKNDPIGIEYYSIFVDLLIMSFAKCVSYGVGGFGELGKSISLNPSCAQIHAKGTKGYYNCGPTF